MRIAAILSDYDGTLCSTSSLRSQNNDNAIPRELESILWDISAWIPICIISSKDFNFLHKKTRFADIVSCILGIETLVLSRHAQTPTDTADKECIIKDPDTSKLGCIKSSQLLLDPEVLENNSQVLANLAEDIESKFNGQVFVERKFATASIITGGETILAGVTIDWRHLKYWESFKKTTEPLLEEMINKYTGQRSISTSSPSVNLYIQTYSSHPFIDVYAIKCNKGLAFDNVISNISHVWKSNNKNQGYILYLGDSENDNPAFRVADISIGVKSDERLNPNLECQYSINFNQLLTFLRGLQTNDFDFSSDLFI